MEIVRYHRRTIDQGQVGRDAEGRPVTVYSNTIEIPEGPDKGQFVTVPGYFDGSTHDDEGELWKKWRPEVLQGRWPIYKDPQQADSRAKHIHGIMDIEGDGGKRGMGMTPEEMLKDPTFLALPPEEQGKALDQVDPVFKAMPPEERQKVLTSLKPTGPRLEQGAQTAPAQSAADPEQPTSPLAQAGQAAARGAQLVGGSLAQGLATFLGAPSDLIETAINGLTSYARYRAQNPDVGPPDVDVPLGGDELNKALPDAMKPPKDMNGAERVVSRGIQEIGSAAVPIAASLKILQTVNPKKLAAIETALAASAGVTAQTLKEMIPNSGPLMEFMGELIGSFGPTGVLKLIRKTRDGIATATGLRTEADIEKSIGEQFNKVATPEQVEAGIKKTDEVNAAMKQADPATPDLKPTTGQVSDSPGLIQSERAYQRSSMERTNKGKVTLQQNQEVIGNFLRGQAPEGKLEDTVSALEATRSRESAMLDAGLIRAQADVDIAKKQVSATTERIVQQADDRAKRAEDAAQTRINALQGRVSKEEAGQILRKEYESELAAYTAEADAKYAKIPQTVPIQPSASRKALAEVRKGIRTQEADEFVPSGALADMDRLGVKETTTQAGPMGKVRTERTEGPTNFGELHALKKRLQGEIRAAKNDTVKWRLKSLLDGVLDDMDQLSKNPEIKAQFPDAAAAYDDANEFARKGIMRLKTGEAAALRHKDKWGRFSTHDEEVAAGFLTGETPLNDFVQALGSRPAARDALKEYAKADLYQTAVYPPMHEKAGQINVAVASKWVKNHEAALKEFPEVRTEVADAAKWQQLATDFRKEADAVAKNPDAVAKIKNPRVYGELNDIERRHADLLLQRDRTMGEWQKSVASQFMGLDADRAAQVIIRNPKPKTMIADVAKRIGDDPDGQAGLNRALWDAALDKFSVDLLDAGGNRALQAKKMEKFLSQNESWMVERFGPEKVESMRKSAEGMRMLESTGKPVLSGGSDTFANLSNVMTNWGPFLSRLYAERSGRASMQWVISERTARVLGNILKARTEEGAMELLDRAFYDPKVAHTMMLAARDAATPLLEKRFRLHLGTPFGAELPEGDQ